MKLVVLLLILLNISCTLTYSITDLNPVKEGDSSKEPNSGDNGGNISGPIIVITSPDILTSIAPITFNITSDRPIQILNISHLNLINGTILSISGIGSNFTILVNPISAGNVELSIDAGVVKDTDGKENQSKVTGMVTYNLPATAATLLKNINLNEKGSYPHNYTKFGSDYFFSADNGVHGVELWKTDGSTAGTVMIKDIVPGRSSSNPTGMTVFNGKLYFGISHSGTPSEFWVSDGSEAGTFKVKDLGTYKPYITNTQPVTKANGFLFFTVKDSNTNEMKLARSDGTADGTYILRADLKSVYIEGVIGNRILFRGDQTGITGLELFYSEGTEATTLILKDIFPGTNNGYFGFNIAFSGGVAVFIANNGTGSKLWRTDGTEANTVLYDASITTNASSSGLGFLKTVGGNTYFMNGTDPKVSLGPNQFVAKALSAINRSFYFASAGTGVSLFSTDGVTVRNHIDLDASTNSWSYRDMIPASLGVFFQVNSALTGWELYFHDGSVSAPTFLGDNNPGASSFLPMNKIEGISLNNKLIFSGITINEGNELWVSDGTVVGTFLLKDIHVGPSSSEPKAFYKDGSFVYFYADNGVNGYELWRTDGTTLGTTMIKNINLLPDSSFPDEFTVVGSEVFFKAKDAKHGNELWKTDGTSVGTILVKDGIANSASVNPRELRNLNGTLVYIGADDLTYGTLWRSDGTSLGTQVIKPGYFDDSGYVGGLTVLGTKAYFQGRDATVGRELFVTDGTDIGTQNLVDLNPGGGSFFDYGSGIPEIFLNMTQGILYFVREMSSYRPWVSDGTTNMANNVSLSNSIENAFEFFEVGNLTYFYGEDSVSGDIILYKSDGTPGGTVEVKNIDPGGNPSIEILSYVNSKLIFTAENVASGRELWVSDGTGAGTQMIKEFTSGADSSNFLASSKVPLGTKTFFVVDDGINGYELWVTDGTSGGTELLKDINPGSASSSPSGFVKFGSYMYFSAETSLQGRELWRTDGTANGTVLVVDIIPGTGSSSPEKITVFGTKLIFTAEDVQGDREVHIYQTP